VQGVFYRATCADIARRAGVSGWVRNLPDGSVEAVFEGPPGDVEALLDWCRQGPPLASVDRLDQTEEEPTGADGFRVLR
jgi:acylphosphatase